MRNPPPRTPAPHTVKRYNRRPIPPTAQPPRLRPVTDCLVRPPRLRPVLLLPVAAERPTTATWAFASTAHHGGFRYALGTARPSGRDLSTRNTSSGGLLRQIRSTFETVKRTGVHMVCNCSLSSTVFAIPRTRPTLR